MERAGTALVTGASTGIGLELSRLFAANGHDLVLVARSKQKLDEVAAELSAKHGVRAVVVAADLQDPGSAARVAEAVAREGITVEYLVNNAGFGANAPFLDTDVTRSLDMIALNVTALTHLTYLFAKGMRERGHGGVLNIGSTAGFQPGPGMAVYYATKAYVVSFTEAIAEEFASGGVHVTAFCPGPVETEFARIAGNDDSVLFKLGAAKADAVAQDAYRTFMKRRVLVIAGATNWLGVQLLRVSPRALVRKVAAWVNSRGDSDGSAGGGSGPRPRRLRDSGPGATAPSRRGPKPEEPHANSARS
jgi:short-subunit dehydrogenase